MITGLNHITLAVTTLEESFEFYKDILRFKPLCKWSKGAYFLVGDLWFCLSVDEMRQLEPSPCYTHIAFSIDENDFSVLKDRFQSLTIPIWKNNKSEGDSLYILDPSGHKLEIHVGHWQSRLAHFKKRPKEGMQFFD